MAGENTTFFYRFGKGGYQAGAICTGVAHSMNVVATESHARQHRAMYPRARALGRFAVQLAFKGYFEYYAFMEFLRGYSKSMMNMADSDKSPGITVTITGDDGFSFMRVGVPVAGITDGDHVGSMLFEPVIIFETLADPLDTKTINEGDGGYSWFENGFLYEGGSADDTTRFFYPVSEGSQNPNLKPEDIYDLDLNLYPGGQRPDAKKDLPLPGPGMP